MQFSKLQTHRAENIVAKKTVRPAIPTLNHTVPLLARIAKPAVEFELEFELEFDVVLLNPSGKPCSENVTFCVIDLL